MSGPAAPASERRVVTVLFADIADFTAMAEGLDPEVVTDAMNAIFASLGAEVEAVGGYVDKVVGDNLMALFGAPVAHEDDAVRAVRAALGMQRAIASRQIDLQRLLTRPVRLRIGIHGGQVVWGAVGPPGQERPTVMGDVVNLASRLQHAAPEDGILVSEVVWRQVRGLFEGRTLEPLVVKGKAEPVAVYEIGRERGRAEPVARPPFVDREDELERLEDLLGRARKGRAQVVLITGDPGIGKTRLVEEFLAHAGGDVALLQTACPPYGGQSLGPLSDLFRQFAGLGPVVTLEDVEAKVPLGERAHQAALILSRLFNLTEVPEQHGVSHETALLVAAEAIRRMLVRPTVVWIEDLHWADAGTSEVLAFIVERLTDTPLLLIGTARAGEAALAWGRRTSVTTLALEPLPQAGALALIEAILGERLPAAVESALVEKSGGNAFYLNEILATLRDRGTLVLDDRGRWRVDGPVEGVLPDTVHAVVLARLDRLSPELRALAQRAAAVGVAFSRSLIATIHPDPDVNVDDALRHLEDAGFVRRRDPLSADPEFVFAHPLLREAAYASLLSKHQTALHRQIAAAIERLYPAERDAMAKTIGTHYAQAGAAEQALPYLVRAGEQAAQRYAAQEAIELLEQSRALAEQTGLTDACLPACELLGELYLRVQDRGPKAWFAVWDFVRRHTDAAAHPRRRARAAIRAAHAMVHDNQIADAWPCLREAETLIPSGDPLWSDFHRVRAHALVMESKYLDGLAAAREAVEIAERAGTLSDRSRAYAVLAHPAILPLLGEQGRRMMRAWVAQAAATGDERLLIEARHFLISDVWTRGIVDDDLLYTVDDALRRAAEYGWTRDEAVLYMLLGWAQFLIGRWPEGEGSLQRAHDLVEAHGGRMHGLYQILLPYFRANLAMAAGRLDGARALFEDAVGKARFHAPIWINHDLARCLHMLGDEAAARAAMARSLEARDRFGCSICGCQANGVAAEFYATVGEGDHAETLAREAEATARQIGHAATLIRVHRARARMALDRGGALRALDAARAALTVGQGLPLAQPFEQAQSLVVLGQALQATGDAAGTIEAWTAARETFAQLSAAWHLAQVEAILGAAQAAHR